MASCVSQIQLLLIFLSVSGAIVSKLYTVNLELDNKVPLHTPSETIPVASLSICACLCRDSCKCFSFNSQTKMCRLHGSCDPANMTVSDTGWKFYTNPTIQPKDCKDVYNSGKLVSGVYTIYPWERSDPNHRPVDVYCDMEIAGGGWTAIQRRINGEENFTRNWTEYKRGFGNPQGDYWIGNDAIYQLTKDRNSSLYVSIASTNYTVLHTVYGQFSVASEDQNYTLHIADYQNGSLEDAMLRYYYYYNGLAGMKFSTFDVDNDGLSFTNCASDNAGGWWFNDCYAAFLNGPWSSDNSPWYGQFSSMREVLRTSMLIKSRNEPAHSQDPYI